MNYHLTQNGQDAGVFSLEELRRRRAATFDLEASWLAGSKNKWKAFPVGPPMSKSCDNLCSCVGDTRLRMNSPHKGNGQA